MNEENFEDVSDRKRTKVCDKFGTFFFGKRGGGERFVYLNIIFLDFVFVNF